jgi:16S rRNA processing protein RimM
VCSSDLVTIISQRPHNKGMLLKFEGINSPEEAGRFRNHILSISTTDKNQLQIGEYYFHDLLGLQVVDEADKTIGTLTDIMETGANDVYVVTDKKGHEILLPAIPDVVIEVDLKAKSMKVHLLPGLADAKSQY